MKIKDREEPSELSDEIYKQMAAVTIMVTQLVVEFAKHIPGFLTLSRDDQIVLLKVLSTVLLSDVSSGWSISLVISLVVCFSFVV